MFENSKYVDTIQVIDSLGDKILNFSFLEQIIIRLFYLQSLLKIGDIKKAIGFTNETLSQIPETKLNLSAKIVYYTLLIIGFSYEQSLDKALNWHAKGQELITKNSDEFSNSADIYWYYFYLVNSANLNMKLKNFTVAFDILKQVNNYLKDKNIKSNSEILLLAWINTLLGIIHKQTNYSDLAINDFRKSLEWGIKAHNIEYTRSAYLYLALTFEEVGKEYIALEIIEELIDQIEKNFDKDEFSLSSAYNLKGNIYGRIGEFNLAKDNYYKAYNVATNDSLRQRIKSFYLNNLGVLAFKSGEFEEALEYYQQALVIAQQKEDPRELSYYYSNIGEVYLAIKQLENALKYETKAIYYLNIIHNEDLLVETYFILVKISLEQKEYQRTERYIKELKKISLNSKKVSHSIKYKFCEAFLLKNQQKIDNAKEIFSQILANANLAYDSKIIALTEMAEMILLSDLKIKQNDYQDLEKISNKLLFLAREKNSLPVICTVAIFYSQVLSMGADYDSALKLLDETSEFCMQKNSIYFKNKIHNEHRKINDLKLINQNFVKYTRDIENFNSEEILSSVRELQRFMLAFAK